jgi:hypothetical protein
MRKPIFPITIWALKRDSLYLLSFCSSLAEALLYARKLPFTPLVVAQTGDLPFMESSVSPIEYGEVLSL